MPPGSDTTELFEAVARIPGGLRFVESFGDVDVVLVYRPREPEVPRRQAVLAVLSAAVDPVPGGGRRWMTGGERQAYLAGRADMADALMREAAGGGGAQRQHDKADPG